MRYLIKINWKAGNQGSLFAQDEAERDRLLGEYRKHGAHTILSTEVVELQEGKSHFQLEKAGLEKKQREEQAKTHQDSVDAMAFALHNFCDFPIKTDHLAKVSFVEALKKGGCALRPVKFGPSAQEFEDLKKRFEDLTKFNNGLRANNRELRKLQQESGVEIRKLNGEVALLQKELKESGQQLKNALYNEGIAKSKLNDKAS